MVIDEDIPVSTRSSQQTQHPRKPILPLVPQDSKHKRYFSVSEIHFSQVETREKMLQKFKEMTPNEIMLSLEDFIQNSAKRV
jgi:hypothetical protein